MSNTKLSVWVTRTSGSAQESAARLIERGFIPIIGPLLEISPASTPNRTPSNEAALAFTSANGVRAFASLSDRRHWPVYAVGDATAKAATFAGFQSVQSANGDVKDLSNLVLDHAPKDQEIIHLSGVHVAGDLISDLTDAGRTASREIIYSSAAVRTLPDAARMAMGRPSPLAVLLYSPKAAHIFNKFIGPRESLQLHVISMSTAIDAVLGRARLASRLIAKRPNEEAMFTQLETLVETLAAKR